MNHVEEAETGGAAPPRDDLKCDFNSGISDSPGVCSRTDGASTHPLSLPLPLTLPLPNITAPIACWSPSSLQKAPRRRRGRGHCMCIGRKDRGNNIHSLAFADWLTYLGADWYGWNPNPETDGRIPLEALQQQYGQRKKLVELGIETQLLLFHRSL